MNWTLLQHCTATILTVPTKECYKIDRRLNQQKRGCVSNIINFTDFPWGSRSAWLFYIVKRIHYQKSNETMWRKNNGVLMVSSMPPFTSNTMKWPKTSSANDLPEVSCHFRSNDSALKWILRYLQAWLKQEALTEYEKTPEWKQFSSSPHTLHLVSTTSIPTCLEAHL